MKRHRNTRATVLIGGAFVVLAACGGGDEGPTKAEFIKEADAICDKADEKFDVILEREVADFDDAKKLSTDGAKLGDALLADLRALEIPKGDEEKVEDVYAGLDRQIRSIRQLGKAAEDENEARIDEIVEEGEKISDDTEKAAKAYGFKSCGIDNDDDQEQAAGDKKSSTTTARSAASTTTTKSTQDPLADKPLPAGSLELAEVEGILSERVEFVPKGRSTLASKSTPAPREARAFETEDGTARFEVLVYNSPAEMKKAEPSVSRAAQSGGFITISNTKNVILATFEVEEGAGTAEAISDVFSEDVIAG